MLSCASAVPAQFSPLPHERAKDPGVDKTLTPLTTLLRIVYSIQITFLRSGRDRIQIEVVNLLAVANEL